MRILNSVGAGAVAVLVVAVVSNIVLVVIGEVLYRNVPDVQVGWTPYVWATIRRSPAFWLAAALSFALVFRWMYGRMCDPSVLRTGLSRY